MIHYTPHTFEGVPLWLRIGYGGRRELAFDATDRSAVTESASAVELVSDYEARKVAGLCTRPGCKRPACDDSAMCERCYRKHKKRNAEAMQRKREARREAKLCVWCPGDNPARATPGSTACLPCRIKRRRLKIADGGVCMDVYLKQREAAIADATHTGDDGRTRYHGQQKRGQQPKAQLNVQDLKHIRHDFEAFSEGVMMLASPEAEQLHRSDLAKAEKQVAERGDAASRRMDDILERLGHFKERRSGAP